MALTRRLDVTALEAKLFAAKAGAACLEPDWEQVHKEKQRKGVMLLLLNRNTRHGIMSAPRSPSTTGAGWVNRTSPQVHAAGEKLGAGSMLRRIVDYAGMILAITDPGSGEMHQVQVFVAVPGASNYTYAEVTESQSGEDWLSSHRRALEFFGSVPNVVVPDNLKAGIKKPCRYEPELNPAYAEFAEHYGLAVVLARVRKPRDKAKAEVGVQIIERSILARLRDHSFFSLREANEAVSSATSRTSRPTTTLFGQSSAPVQTYRAETLPKSGRGTTGSITTRRQDRSSLARTTRYQALWM